MDSKEWQSWSLPPFGQRQATNGNNNYHNEEVQNSAYEQQDKKQQEHTAENPEGTDEFDSQSEEVEESVETLESEELIPPSAEELEELRKSVELDAYQKGFAKGEAHGLESGEQRAYQETKSALEQQIDELRQITTALMQPTADQDEAIERILVDSVIAIAKGVVHRELRTHPDDIVALVSEAVAALPKGADQISVFLNPDNLELVRTQVPESEAWTLIEDTSIEPGGCRLESKDSAIDATVSSRLRLAVDQFLNQRTHS
jgi:flagellar assembly protein FliH